MSVAVETAIRGGDLDLATRLVIDEIRAAPSALEPRLVLFQVAIVSGDWGRARKQLDTMADLDPETATFARAHAGLIEGEALRRQVFAGRASPTVLGTPPAFTPLLIEALALAARGESAAAADLRARALDAADAVPGEADGASFEWLMDADPRLGPVLEVMLPTGYRWLPLASLHSLKCAGPRDLKDAVWLPVTLVLANGSETAAYLPARYPGSEAAADPLLRLARATSWVAQPDGSQHGLGQRLLATDADDLPILALRSLTLRSADA